MPLKLNVGLAKKVGLPEYGSLGASCYLECELDGSLLTTNLDRFHEQVREAFAACSQAVEEELTRATTATDTCQPELHANGKLQTEPPTARFVRNGHGQRTTAKQIDFVQQLAHEIRGLGMRRLEALAVQMFEKPLADLTSVDASSLIEMLKDVKAGKIDLDTDLAGDES